MTSRSSSRSSDAPLVPLQVDVHQRHQVPDLAGEDAAEHDVQLLGDGGRPLDPDLGVAEAERQDPEAVAELAEEVVDPGVVGGEGVHRALVDGTAEGQPGQDGGLDELEVTAHLGREAGEPPVERPLAPAIIGVDGERRRPQAGARLEQRPPDEVGEVGGGGAEGGGEIGHGKGPFREHEKSC